MFIDWSKENSLIIGINISLFQGNEKTLFREYRDNSFDLILLIEKNAGGYS